MNCLSCKDVKGIWFLGGVKILRCLITKFWFVICLRLSNDDKKVDVDGKDESFNKKYFTKNSSLAYLENLVDGITLIRC